MPATSLKMWQRSLAQNPRNSSYKPPCFTEINEGVMKSVFFVVVYKCVEGTQLSKTCKSTRTARRPSLFFLELRMSQPDVVEYSHFTRLTQLANGRLFVADDKTVGSSWQRERTLEQTTDCSVSVHTDDNNQAKKKQECNESSFRYRTFHNKGSRRFRMK